jgi:hypothetical protein
MTHEDLKIYDTPSFSSVYICSAFDHVLIVDEKKEVVIDSLTHRMVGLRHVICRLPTSTVNPCQIRRMMMTSTYSLFVPKREREGRRKEGGENFIMRGFIIYRLRQILLG